MRGRLALVIRLICTFALIVAAMPLRASTMSCAEPTPKPVLAHSPQKESCAMPCCQAKPAKASMEAMGCCKPGHEIAAATIPPITSAAVECACELQSLPTNAARREEGLSPGISFPVLALAPQPLDAPTFVAEFAEPGIFGIDSGPPLQAFLRRERGRAPPVS